MSSHFDFLKVVRFRETGSRMVVSGGGVGGRNGELVFNGIEFPFGNMTVLEMDGGDGCMTL